MVSPESPLAGDINWMETLPVFVRWQIELWSYLSPLAGDINWMETRELVPSSQAESRDSPHSLGTLIEWKLFFTEVLKKPPLLSPLAGDINWMETQQSVLFVIVNVGPHSLGTLIEWKLQLGYHL